MSKNKGIPTRSADSADFVWKLAVGLVYPHILQRKALHFTHLTSATKNTINYFLSVVGPQYLDQNQNVARVADANRDADADRDAAGDAVGEAVGDAGGGNMFSHPWRSEKSERCVPCMVSIQGPGYSQRRRKFGQTDVQCQMCGKHICKNHRVILCQNCAGTLTVRPEPEDPDRE